MLLWNQFPFVRFAFAAIGGILLSEAYPPLWNYELTLLVVLAILLIIVSFLFLKRGISSLSLLTGLFGFSMIAMIVGSIHLSNNPLLNQSHWRNQPSQIIAFSGRVNSTALEKSRTTLYTIDIDRVKTKSNVLPASGKLHLYVKNDSSELFRYGDNIWVKATPSEIPRPTNPEEFNYSAYIARQYILGQCFTESSNIKVLSNEPNSAILATAFRLRAHLQERIEYHIENADAESIALALLIGVKDFLPEDLKTAYASAGAMHVLAVSGLHVGILYLVLGFLFKPLEKKKYGKYILAALSILIIWMYTFVTGMSPSVLRAAVMFSIMATGKALGRNNSIYNSLGIAAFILLIFDPNLIFSVGFQLSFLALTGIVYLQPKIYRLLLVSNYFLDKVWQITAVSIAAQIATLPLTIYYFHQFPTYFFLSNLVVIPGATIIMFAGIGTLILDTISASVGALIASLLEGTIWLMNFLVRQVELIPGSLITWLYLDNVQVIALYMLIVLIFLGVFHKSAFYLNISLILLMTIFGRNIIRHQERLENEELIIYDFASSTAIDHIHGMNATLHIGSLENANTELLKFQIDPFRRSNGLKPYDDSIIEFTNSKSTNSSLKFGTISKQKVVILDSMLVDLEIENPIYTDILVINNQSIKSIDWLQANFQFKKLIIGSENSFYYSNWLKAELTKAGIHAHSLLLDGSWRRKIISGTADKNQEQIM